jgi:hypothetical protein
MKVNYPTDDKNTKSWKIASFFLFAASKKPPVAGIFFNGQK